MEQDYIDLFTEKRKGHMAKYVYMYRPYIYEDILNQETYYPFRRERDLLKNASEEICKNLLDVDEVLELGPGSKTAILSKTVPFLRGLRDQIGLCTYKAIDSTLEYAQQACQIINEQFDDIKTEALGIDFISRNAFHKIETTGLSYSTKLMIAFGQPLFANNNDCDIEVLLKNIRGFLKKNDSLLFGIDTNQNEKLLEEAYHNNLVHEFLLNSMHYLKTTLNLKDFHSEAFDLIYRWNREERAVELSLKSTVQHTLTIRECEIVIEKGQEFNIMNSRKPPLETIEKFLSKEHLTIKNVISSDGDKDNKFSIVIVGK